MVKCPVVSVATIVKDVAEVLPNMIRSARPVADEFVLVDTGSTDDTIPVARALGARVIEFPWCDSFAAARNVALDHARGNWILVLDADDHLLSLGATAVRYAISWPLDRPGGRLTGYVLNISEQTLNGQPLGLVASSMRLFPRKSALRYVGRVHEEIQYLPDPFRKLRVGQIEGVHIVHTGYDPSLAHAKIERNICLLRMRLDDNPDDGYAAWYLADHLAKIGQHDEAWEFGQRALASGQLAPEHCQAMRRLKAPA